MSASLFPVSVPLTAISEPLFGKAGVTVEMARLDMVHEVVSGNKLFKLRYYLQEASTIPARIVTFGGAWSNHLVATAHAARLYSLKCRGIVRGERPAQLNQALKDCQDLGMELEFVDRPVYRELCLQEGLTGNDLYIPEGGYSVRGAEGAARIAELLPGADIYSVAVGTATTAAGLCLGLNEKSILCVPAIRNMNDLEVRLRFLAPQQNCSLEVDNRFHFGGFARYDKTLLNFMNDFYKKHGIALDFIYTAKLMFTLYQRIREGHYPQGTRICCLHTGGLQGNRSLEGQLSYL